MENIEKKECAHPLCHCPAEPGSDFCCEACELARNETDCPCGHFECRARA